jgi:TatD DNase family protein
MIYESHAHYDDEAFDGDREELLASLFQGNVGVIVNVGADIASSRASISLAERYDRIFASVGVHPDEVSCLEEQGISPLREMMTHPKVVAIGEIGLDYYRDKTPEDKALQKKWFLQQLELAVEAKKPAIIHSRDAAEDTMTILREFMQQHPEITNPGVVHCYSYSPEMAKTYISMGFYIGVGGVITFKNAKKLVETVEQIPLERILVETDSPYLSPEPYRGQRNQSDHIQYVITKIAEIKEISTEEVEAQTASNWKQVFGVEV